MKPTPKRPRKRRRPKPSQRQAVDDVLRETFRGLRSSWGARVPAGRR